MCRSRCGQLAPVVKGNGFLLHKNRTFHTQWVKGQQLGQLEKLFIDALKKKKEEKDNQYRLKQAMAIAIGLTQLGQTLFCQNMGILHHIC